MSIENSFSEYQIKFLFYLIKFNNSDEETKVKCLLTMYERSFSFFKSKDYKKAIPLVICVYHLSSGLHKSMSTKNIKLFELLLKSNVLIDLIYNIQGDINEKMPVVVYNLRLISEFKLDVNCIDPLMRYYTKDQLNMVVMQLMCIYVFGKEYSGQGKDNFSKLYSEQIRFRDFKIWDFV